MNADKWHVLTIDLVQNVNLWGFGVQEACTVFLYDIIYIVWCNVPSWDDVYTNELMETKSQ